MPWIRAPLPLTHSYVVDVLYEGNRVSGLVSEATSTILPGSPMQQKNESRTPQTHVVPRSAEDCDDY